MSQSPAEQSVFTTTIWRENVSARELTTFGVGAAVPALVEINCVSSGVELLNTLERDGREWRILGAGSNVVLPDDEIEQTVLRLGRGLIGASQGFGVRHEAVETVAERLLGSEDEALICVSAATSLMALSRILTALGLSGLEFAAGIPASVGGAVAMNAGAHGGCIGDVLRSVHLISAQGETVIPAKELNLAYRHCELPDRSIIVGAEFELSRDDVESCKKRRRDNLLYRKNTQPLHLPSAGSVFRNPEDMSAGALLEQSGFKGKQSGGVSFSELHANWLVRCESEANSADVALLVEQAVDAVKSEFGVLLEPEIRLW